MPNRTYERIKKFSDTLPLNDYSMLFKELDQINIAKCALVWVVRVVQLVKVEENQVVNAVLGWSAVSG